MDTEAPVVVILKKIEYNAYIERGINMQNSFYPELTLQNIEDDKKRITFRIRQGKQNGYVAEDETGMIGSLNLLPDEKCGEYSDIILLYQKLKDLKTGRKSSELADFIPSFELYSAEFEDGKQSFLWLYEQGQLSFDQVINQIRSDGGKNAEKNLRRILNLAAVLADCTAALHEQEFYCKTLTAEQIGLWRTKEERIRSLVFRDISEIKPFQNKEADIRHNIADIGRILFQTLVITEETQEDGGIYRDEYADRICSMIDSSLLICSSEQNAHPYIRHALTMILENCLNDGEMVYTDCRQIADDLRMTLYQLFPEKSTSKGNGSNSGLTVQYHLYESPLYQMVGDDEQNIRILILGFGGYGQKFLDYCLQTGQDLSQYLQVTVISRNLSDKEIYLQSRPELIDFFCVDGSLNEQEESWGTIQFGMENLTFGTEEPDVEVLNALIKKIHPHYCFIALGNDGLNVNVSAACRKLCKNEGISCSINFVEEKERDEGTLPSDMHPVQIYKNIGDSQLSKEIERMAFNVHLVWEKGLNLDYSTVREDFRKPYNHDASVSCVLSIKYKLHSVGIDLDQYSFQEAAELFARISGKQLKNKLICAEHSRWVTEKLCNGWRRMRNLDECVGGRTSDKRRKLHICICHSKPDRKLTDNWDGKWDSASEWELQKLDEIDRLSVEMHRMYVKQAKKVKKQNILNGNLISAIRMLIADDRKASVSFQEWFTCMKEIWNDDTSKVQLYKALKRAFLEAASGLELHRKKALFKAVNSLEEVFWPIVASGEYRDYKQDDIALIDHIPFILTYTDDIYMVIPFIADGSGFENICAATVVNPFRIIYIYALEHVKDWEAFIGSLSCVVNYMKKKHLRAGIDLILIVNAKTVSLLSENPDEQFRSLLIGKLRQLKIIRAETICEIANPVYEYLEKRAQGKRKFVLEQNNSKFSYLLAGAGIYEKFDSYTFHSEAVSFKERAGHRMFGFIKKRPFITVADMIALSGSVSVNISQPEFFGDYQELWEMYQKNTWTWKYMCDQLGKYADENDTVQMFVRKSSSDCTEMQSYRFLIPSDCQKAAEQLLYQLKTYKIASEGSMVSSFMSDACEVLIKDRYDLKDKYSYIFSNPYILSNPDAFNIFFNAKKHAVEVRFDHLIVKGVCFSNKKSQIVNLLEFFKQKGYINGLNISDDKVYFTYATRQIKKLMTSAGRIFEIYVYHQLKEYGKFDDVVSGYEISWKGSNITNEFDCIVTKGFSSLFVECKMRPELDQNYYFKISSLARQFGINAKAVLLADTQEKDFYDTAKVNDMQRQRGRMMDVVTVYRQKDIENIGKTFMKILNGNFEQE